MSTTKTCATESCANIAPSTKSWCRACRRDHNAPTCKDCGCKEDRHLAFCQVCSTYTCFMCLSYTADDMCECR